MDIHKHCNDAVGRLAGEIEDLRHSLEAARREGVIEGLEMALAMDCFHHGYVSKSDIRAEIERLRAELTAADSSAAPARP